MFGESRSISDFIKRMNAVMNPDDPGAYSIPDDQLLIAQYLLLYSMSGEPDDFDDVVDYDYRIANVRLLAVSDHSPVLDEVFDLIDDRADAIRADEGSAAVWNTLVLDFIIADSTLSAGLYGAP